MTGSVIVITSGKGGVGKTTTSANIGTALAKDGSKVVLIDTDIGLRNLDLLLGLENRIVYTIVDVVEERCKLKQALVKDKKNPNLCLLAAAQTRDKSAVTEEQLKDICEQLKEEFDYILVDCPAGIEQGFQNAVAGANEAIVVTTPEMSAVRDADRIIGLLEAKEEVKKYRLLVNRVRPNLVKTNDMMSVDDVVGILSMKNLLQGKLIWTLQEELKAKKCLYWILISLQLSLERLKSFYLRKWRYQNERFISGALQQGFKPF